MSTGIDPVELSATRAGRLALRALRLRCPHCGRGALFQSWLRLSPHCASCGLLPDRGESDHFIGGYLLNLIVAELLIVAGLVGVVTWTWPAVPWDALTYGLAGLMVPAPFITYPFSKALWIAIDLHFQPPTRADFVESAAGPPAARHAPPR